MGLKLCCDGCLCDGTTETLTETGRLGKVWYCVDCLPRWKEFETWEREERTQLVQAFETERTVRLGFLRGVLKLLPDE